jgi:hypothetical protein
MSEFKDVTADVVNRLNRNLPSGDGVEFPDRINSIKTLIRIVGDHSELLYDPKKGTWIGDLTPNAIGPFAAVLSRPDSPIRDVVSLGNNVSQPQTETLMLEHPGRDPRLYAVSYPKDLLRVVADEYFFRVPFLVYFRPQLTQSIEERFKGQYKRRPGYYIGYDTLGNDPSRPVPAAKRSDEEYYYPYGWDYLYFTFWNYLNYGNNPLFQRESYGLQHQIAASGKRLVLVIPMLSRDHLAADLTSPAKLLNVLGQIRDYLAARLNFEPDPQLGRVALAAFSGGNMITRDLLNRLNFSSPIKEVYNFDAPYTKVFPLGEQWVSAALSWLRVEQVAAVRVYTQTAYPNLQRVVNTTLRDGDHLSKTMDGLRSAALISTIGWNRLTGGYLRSLPPQIKDILKIPRTMNDPVQIGERFIKTLSQTGQPRFNVQHHWFAALMLTDALRRSGFK